MASVHYENGHYHLHKELKTISELQQNHSTQKTPASEKLNENTSPQQITESDVAIYRPASMITLNFLKEPELLEGCTPGTFRPPSRA